MAVLAILGVRTNAQRRDRLRSRSALFTVFTMVATVVVSVVTGGGEVAAVRTPGELLRYDFTEGSGAVVADTGSGTSLDLTIDDPGNVTWQAGGGLTIDAPTRIASSTSTKIATAVAVTNEFTVEAWVSSDDVPGIGRGQLVTSGRKINDLNFALYERGSNESLATRIRSRGSYKGTPELFTSAATAPIGTLSQVVMTRSSDGTRRIYVDGIALKSSVVSGALDNWTTSFPFVIGNDGLGNDPFLGTICRVAVYDSALTQNEIDANFAAGCSSDDPSNTDPQIDSLPARTDAEGETVNLSVTASDSDGDPLAFSATGLPSGLDINSSTGAVSGLVTQAAANGSVYDTVITVTDGRGGSASAAFDWTITAVNFDPVVNFVGPQSAVEGQTVSLAISASDVDGDTLTFSAQNLPTGLSMNTGTGIIGGQVAAGAKTDSPYNVTVTVTDGAGGSDSIGFPFTIGVATLPQAIARYDFTAGSGDIVADSGAGVGLDLQIADESKVTWIPGGGLTIDATTKIESLTAATKVVNAAKASGEMTVEAWISTTGTTSRADIVSNGPNFSNTNFLLSERVYNNRFTFRVRSIGSYGGSPELRSSNGAAVPDQLTHLVATRDAAGKRIMYVDGVQVSTNNKSGSLSNWDTSHPLLLANTSNNPFIGSYCRVAIYDVALAAGEVNAQFGQGCQLGAPNNQPSIDPIADQSDDEGTSVSLTATASDPDGDALTYSATDLPAGLIMSPATGVISGTIAGTAATGSPYTVSVSIDDGRGGIASTTFTWTVAATNVSPQIDQPAAQSSGEGAVVTLQIVGTDSDGDSIQFSATGLPTGLGIDANGLITGTIEAGASGDSPFTVEVTADDGAGGVATTTFQWTVAVITGPTPIAEYLFTEGSGSVVGDSGPGSPLDLSIDNMSNVTWIPGGGLAVEQNATITSGGPATKIIEAAEATDELTIEAWITPSGETSGRAQIVNSGVSNSNSNFQLFERAYNERFAMRVRSASTFAGTPELISPNSSVVPDQLTHVVVTRDDTGKRVMYLDGQQVRTNTKTQPFSNWNAGHPLSIGSFGGGSEDFVGVFCTVRLYDVALDASDVSQRYATGCTGDVTPAGPASALVTINEGDGVAASTFSGSPIAVTNTGTAGAPAITKVEFDLTGSMIPDATFDPVGDAGDALAKCVVVGSEGGTGYIAPGDPCTDPFSIPHEDAPGTVGNGFDGLTLNFDDFQAGETLTFAVDIDPTTIQGVAGAGGTGAVSGLELTGSTVTVTFADGQTVTSRLFGDGSQGGAAAAAMSTDVGTATQSPIELVGVAAQPTVFNNNSSVASVDAVGPQTVRVSGPAGATVVLQIADTTLENPTGFDIDPYEADAVTSVQYLVDTVGAGGTVDFPLNVTDPTVLYDVIANIGDGTTMGQSQQLIVTVQTPAAALVQITPGEGIDATTYGDSKITVTNTGDANAPAIAGVSFDLRGSLIPDATFDPVGTAGDDGTQCLEVSIEGGTGYVVPGDNCTDPFSLDHEDSPGVVGNGHDGMSLDFTDFDGGESIVFGVDVDPTTIQSVPGAGGAGAVSGFELAGSTVTVVFTDGQVTTSPIFGDGTAGGGQAVVTSAAGVGAPVSIELVGTVAAPTVFTNDSIVAEVPASGLQTVRITGAPGAAVTLLDVDTELQSPAPFDLDPFESDAAVAVSYVTDVIGVGGTLDVVVDIDDATVLHNFVALVDDGVGSVLTQKLIVAVDTPAGALLQITPNSTNLDASTFTAGSMSISNTGEVGDAAIVSVNIDLRGSIVPDATFDPNGTAGDTAAKCLVISSGAVSTGYTAPVDPCVGPFSVAHEDEPGVPGEGFDVITLDFTEFDPGETISFAVDIDATTIQGVDGSGGAGSVSGLELTGSLVTVTFADGATQTVSTNQLFADGSVGGSQSFVSNAVGQVAPTAIEVVGVTTVPTVFTNGSQVGSVPVVGSQIVRVTAAEGDAVTLLQMTGDVVTDPAFDLDDFESDTAIAADYFSGVVDATGVIDFPVDIASADVLYHFVAVVNDGATGANSTQLLIGVGLDVNAPVFTPIADVAVDFGNDVNVAISATAPEAITLSVSAAPMIGSAGFVFTDNGDGTGSVAWTTEAADVGSYEVTVTATTASSSSSETFTISVIDPDAVPTVLFRVNSGGSEVADPSGGIPWTEDNSTTTSGGTAAGTPSQYLASGTDQAYATTDVIDLTDPSVPAGTPEALFQSERYSNTPVNPVTYEFPVGSGQDYTVDLYFAEIFLNADDAREFTINIEGTDVAVDFDIHEQVGHDTGLVATFTTPVADDSLTITFVDEVEDNPKINAIEVRTASPAPTDVPPTITPIVDQTVTVGGTLNVAVATQEPDGDAVTITQTSTPDASAFTTFTPGIDGTATFDFAPAAADVGAYSFIVTASDVDGSTTEEFVLTVNAPATTVFARINAGGPAVTAIDAGPDWEQDNTASPSQHLAEAGSGGNSGGPLVEPDASVPSYVPGAVFDTERWSNAGFSYDIPVPAGTQVFVRLFLGNEYAQTSEIGERVFDISIDGVLVEDDLDLVAEYGHQLAGMREYQITSDGTIDINFINDLAENPLVNAIEIASAQSSPGVLGATPPAADFGTVLTGGSATETVTLTNLGFDAGDSAIEVTAITVSNGDFTTNFVGPVSIPAGGSTTFDVTFSPTADGAQSGTATITHDGTNTPLAIQLDGEASNDIPVSFGSSGLSGDSSTNPTSLQFGPDDRLYVASQKGPIKAYTIVRNGADDYQVTATETIDLVDTDTANHNDDGSADATQDRQKTGLLVTGTPTNPVLYVTSSDSRIAVGNDSGLDTNSGIVHRLTFNGTSWDKVEIVRGLPRSEENHATNGMAIDEANNTLYVMQGGHANKGAPGNNFSGTPEYYLSAALLSVDLDAIDALGTFTDARDGATVAYDLRTLDDPTRANITNADAGFPYPSGHPLYNSSIDIGDPFGGNNSLNQAIPEPGGPVQIYSPGYRNAFDVVLTEAGNLYTSDNGPNTNWGGVPLSYDSNGSPIATGSGPYELPAGSTCTNEFNDTNSQGHGDPLLYISGQGYYGGHPAPIRAFPGSAKVVQYSEQGNGNWVLTEEHDFFDLLPADLAASFYPSNPAECDYTSNDPANYLDINNASSNGIAEYTASNFGGKLKGDLLVASFSQTIYSYDLNAAGDDIDSKISLFGGFGSQPLDVVAQGDGDIFPGTVWAAVYGSNNIQVFEPADAGSCSGADNALLDEDGDGFDNADEIDNGTNPCSAGEQPSDNDGDLTSDLNDPDDDNDGIDDVDDEFAVDPDNGLTTQLPVLRPFENGDPGTFLFGLGLTGLMTNGVDTYLEQFDPGTLAAGGNGGELGIEVVTAGDAHQGTNTQENAFQYGVDLDSGSDPFVVSTSLTSPIFGDVTPQNFMSMGLQVGAGDQDNYLKLVVNANGGAGGVQVLKEVGGATSGTQYGAAEIGGDVLTGGDVALSIVIDPALLTAQPRVQVASGPIVDIGPPVTIPAAWLDAGDENGFAVGVISTSNGPGAEFPVLFAYLDVEEFVPGNTAPTVSASPNAATIEDGEAIPTIDVTYSDPDAGDTLTLALDGNEPSGITLTDNGDGTATIDGTPTDGPSSVTFDVTVSDGSLSVSAAITITVTTPTNEAPGFDTTPADESTAEGSAYSQQIDATDPNGDTISYSLGGAPAGMTISASGLIEWTTDLANSGSYDVTVTIDDSVNAAVSAGFTLSVTQTDQGIVLRRINLGGAAVTATDGGLDWEVDTNASPASGRSAGGEAVYGGNTPITDISDPSVPTGTPLATFNAERYDQPTGDEMTWNFAAAPGSVVEVRVGQGEIFSNGSTPLTPGAREYGITIDGVQVDTGIDPVPESGQNPGFITDYLIVVDGDGIDIVFDHETQNPNPKSFEIIEVIPAPPAAPSIDSVTPTSPVTVTQGTTIPTVTVTASDANNDAIALTTDGAEPTGVVFTDNGDGTATFAGSANATPGTYGVVVTASDGALTDTETITFEIVGDDPPVFDLAPADGSTAETSSYTQQIQASDPEAGAITYTLSGDVPVGMTISTTGLIEWTPDLTQSGISTIVVELDDGANAVTDDFVLSVTQTEPDGSALFRVNVGGPAIATPGGSFPDWESDNGGSPSVYYTGGGAGFAGSGTTNNTGHPTVPTSAPAAMYETERYGDATYNFPVASGTEVEVRIHLNETFAPQAATRQFDIVIDGTVVGDDINPVAESGGQNTAVVLDYLVTADADGLDIDVVTVTNNAALKGIEIIGVNGVPAVAIANDLDGSTIITDSVTVAWMFNGFDNPGVAHAHFSISSDGGTTYGAATPMQSSENGAGTHNTLYRPDTFIDLTDLADGDFVVRVQVADSSHTAYPNPEATATATFTVDTPTGAITSRFNAGGPTVAANDGGPDWLADSAALLISSGSTTGGFAINGYDASVPAYAQIDALFTSERYDGSNGAAPDDMTYAIDVSAPGASATVNLFMMNGWTGSDLPGEREFDVYIEGILVLDELDLTATYGHAIAALETFAVTDSTGDGKITIVFEHGTGPENPLINAIEVIG